MSEAAPGQVRVGIAGLGLAGVSLLEPLLRHRRCRLAAVADTEPGRLETEATRHGAATEKSVDALVARDDVDAVYVATPTHLHAAHALAALAAGKHVIVEKPMAVSLEEAAAVIDAAAARGLVLMVGHSHSFEPAIRAIGNIARDGSLGRLEMVHNWCYSDWLYRPRLPAELDARLGGGVLMRQGAHQVDILRWIAGGLVRSVRARVGRPDPARPADANHVLFLEFADGAAATAVYSGSGRFDSAELTFGVGESGASTAGESYARARKALASSPDEAAAKRAATTGARSLGEAGGFFGLTIATFERADVRQVPRGLRVYGDAEVNEMSLAGARPGRDAMLDELAAAVLDGEPAAHDGPWGRANLEVCLAARDSWTQRREIELRFQVPVPPGRAEGAVASSPGGDEATQPD